MSQDFFTLFESVGPGVEAMALSDENSGVSMSQLITETLSMSHMDQTGSGGQYFLDGTPLDCWDVIGGSPSTSVASLPPTSCSQDLEHPQASTSSRYFPSPAQHKDFDSQSEYRYDPTPFSSEPHQMSVEYTEGSFYQVEPLQAPPASPAPSYPLTPHKMDMESRMKRKGSAIDLDSEPDDDDDRCSRLSDDNRSSIFSRVNHSEIEKRRRDKMNSYITELSTMVPLCNAMNRKLDKLTVLRMAVQHMKTLRGAGELHTEVSHKPAYLSDDELKHLILKAAEGFLFVVGCDRGKILYVSESVRNILHLSQAELIGQSWFDFLHLKDITKIKEQLLSSDLSPREKLIDAKTMLPVKTEMPQQHSRLCSGARRAFFCRMKTGNKAYPGNSSVKTEKDLDIETTCHKKKRSDRKNFSVIHFAGYLKSWPPAKMGFQEDNEDSGDSCNLSCLVAVGKLVPPFSPQSVPDSCHIQVRQTEFVSRHTSDGKFTYVDQRATTILGYLPQELLGTSVYEYYHQEDLEHLSETHRKVLISKEPVTSWPYRFKGKDGSFIHLKTKAFSFRNPWVKEVEYIVATNTVVPTQEVSSSSFSLDAQVPMEEEEMNNDNNGFSGKDTKLGAGRIGRQIADEIAELHKNESPFVESTSTFSTPKQPLQKKQKVTHNSGPQPSTSRQHPSTSRTGPSTSRSQPHSMMSPPVSSTSTPVNGLTVSVPGPGQIVGDLPLLPPSNSLEDNTTEGSSSDGQDEAAMAVIMSLLEADAGLGGPVDFSDFPWPL